MNPTVQYNKGGKQFKFAVTNAQDWQVTKFRNCPAYQNALKGKDGNQHCFLTEVSGLKVYIPQLEMARVLFYHDPFLARLSLQHNALVEDFYVELNGEMQAIHVLDGAEYPLHHFNRDDNRRFLSWVLMDPCARRSFESISANLLINKNRQGNYYHWDFHFSPPPLTGVELSIIGWDDFASKRFFVWEVTHIEGLASSVTGEQHHRCR